MEKKINAFTLIELLAVIVILATIFLIATPAIFRIIDDSKKDSFLKNVQLLVSTVNIDYASKGFQEEYTYTITDGIISNLEMDIKNTEGMNGEITYLEDGNKVYAVHNEKYCVQKTEIMSKVEISEYSGECSATNKNILSISPNKNKEIISVITNPTIKKIDLQNVWVNTIEYDNTENRGQSRFSIKVDKSFIGDIKTNYDVIIDYYDEGDGIVLMQSSSTPNNTINYSGYGYGGYVEEGWWTWKSRNFYFKNLSFGLANTKEWQQYTIPVTSDFFEEGIDNYIHFYFGKPIDNNEFDTVKIKKITICKRNFIIESSDTNNANMVGNIYTNDDFGMGFNIINTSNVDKNIHLSASYYHLKSIIYQFRLNFKQFMSFTFLLLMIQ